MPYRLASGVSSDGLIELGTTKARNLPQADGNGAASRTQSARRHAAPKAASNVTVPEAAASVGEGAPAEAPPQVIRSIAGTVIDPMSLLFDTDWYRVEYPDVAAAGLDPIRHFFDNGAREGRNPNAHFETSWYVSTNADVAASMMNPFLHYLLYGAREGRKSRP